MFKKCKFRRFGIMLDNSRNAVMKPDAVKKYIDLISHLGYNSLSLYTEDTYELKRNPYFGHNRGKYSIEELKSIDEYAKLKGIELIPCIQTLAHLDTIMRWAPYSEIHDCEGILLANTEATYKLIDDMFATLSEAFSSRTVNIGMDEANMLGRGKYYDINGEQDKVNIFINHLRKVADIAKKYGFEIIMWGDMFIRLLKNSSQFSFEAEDSSGIYIPDELKNSIPENVNLIYWDYYSTDKKHYDDNITTYSAIKNNIWFAGGLWSWTGFTPHNRYSIKTIKAAFSSCIENGVKDVFLTFWGNDGAECSKFALLPSIFYAAQLAKGITDEELIKENFFKEFNIKFDDFMQIDLIETPNGRPRMVNAEKYLLYNDCFMGLFDTKIMPSDADSFKKEADILYDIKITDEYSYIFKTAKALCDVLSLKTDIGIRVRKSYKNQDKLELQKIAVDYDRIITLIENLYLLFEKQWMIENKPHGFDIQDIRFGGLILRIKHCKNRLISFINNEIPILEELEEEPLDANGYNKSEHNWYYQPWGTMVSTNVI